MKEFIILGKTFVKFTNPSDNVWEVSRIVDLSDDDLQGIVDRNIKSGKSIFIYDCHNPKDTREIVGEIDEITFDNGIKASIQWNDKGKSILASESRYPSVELAPNSEDATVWDLVCVAMVGEPASKDVDVLELNALENNYEGDHKMDEMIKEVIEEGLKDPDSMRVKLTEMITEDPTKMALIIDAFVDTLKEGASVEESEEVVELAQDEKDKKDESIGTAESDEKKGDDTELEKDKKKEDLESKEKKAGEELTALAYEYGAKFGKGVPTANSLSQAVELFKDLMKTKLTKSEKQELAFAKLEFVGKKQDLTAEELSAIEGGVKKEIVNPATQLGNAFRGM